MAKRTNKEELPHVDTVQTAAERKALHGETPELKALYDELRIRRDFTTGVSGQRTRISDKALKEGVGYVSKPGRKRWVPSTKHLERWLDQLEFLGLIKKMGQHVFYLPLAAKYPPNQKISHQGVTKGVPTGVTNSDIAQTPINTEEKTTSETKVSPEVSPQVGQRLSSPLNNTLHNITLPNAHEFFQLLASQGYYLNQLHSNKKTLAMVHAWVSAKVTLDEAQIGINHVNAQLGRPPDSPTYYNKPVLQVRDDFNKAQLQAQEITSDAKPNRTPKPNRTKPFETLVERTRRELDESLAQTKERIRRSKH